VNESIGKFLLNMGDDDSRKGIFDVETQTFTPGFDPDIMFVAAMPFAYVPEDDVDEAAVQELDNTVFKAPFAVDEVADADGLAVGECLKKWIAMGLHGDGYTRKQMPCYVGSTNCGKGLLSDTTKAAFGNYVGDDFAPQELCYQPLNSQDVARRNAWVLKLQRQGARIAFGNENPVASDDTKAARAVAKINGETFKRVVAGGDPMPARDTSEKSVIVRNRTLLVNCSNDIPQFSPSPSIDTAIAEKLQYIHRALCRFVVKSKIDASKPELKPMKAGVKDLFKTDKYKAAYFWLIQRCYRAIDDDEKQPGGEIMRPARVQEESADWTRDEGQSFEDIFSKQFVVTHSFEDTTLLLDIMTYMEAAIPSKSSVYIGRAVCALVDVSSWTGTQKDSLFKKKNSERDKIVSMNHVAELHKSARMAHGITTVAKYEHATKLAAEAAAKEQHNAESVGLASAWGM
jgi:hypothetical protein